MTIPLDNLYHYIQGLFTEPVCVYLFYPHGSRNILELIKLEHVKNSYSHKIQPQVICHDQEPLNYQLYQEHSEETIDYFYNSRQGYLPRNILKNLNIKIALPINIHDHTILIHSEQNSIDLDLYKKDGYVDVHYWCHAFLARDWYRFAEYDARLTKNFNATDIKDFLIYCRDWTGTREYRLKFQELLYKNNLVKHSITGILKFSDNDHDVNKFMFKNLDFVPNNTDFFNHLINNNIAPSASADYCPSDFVKSHLSVVLETVFDGSKIHLTEKILRPIACGHPFILAAGPGSLEYIRRYGFKTFSPWINEDYDQELDSVRRLEKIIKSMNDFSNLSLKDKTNTINQIKKIANYNKKWFFSKNFINLVNQELLANINTALTQIKKTRCVIFRSRSKHQTSESSNKQDRKIIAENIRQLKNVNSSLK